MVILNYMLLYSASAVDKFSKRHSMCFWTSNRIQKWISFYFIGLGAEHKPKTARGQNDNKKKIFPFYTYMVLRCINIIFKTTMTMFNFKGYSSRVFYQLNRYIFFQMHYLFNCFFFYVLSTTPVYVYI